MYGLANDQIVMRVLSINYLKIGWLVDWLNGWMAVALSGWIDRWMVDLLADRINADLQENRKARKKNT